MILDAKECAEAGLALEGCVLSELAKARCPRDDLAHFVCSDFVAAEPKKFTRDVLNLVHAKAECHQLGTECHQAAAHQPGEAAVAARGRDRSFGTRDLVDQSLNLVGGTLVAEKTQNDADGFFRDSVVNADLYGQRSNQFVHMAPALSRFVPGRVLVI